MFIKTCYNINTIKKGANYAKINKCRGGGNLTAPNRGFTLAEVLVTLGIIGVVSAMTVPTLMQNYQRKSYVTQLHKVYNELNQALLQYQTDKNALNLKEAGLTTNEACGEFLKKYFKIVQDCGDNQTPCFADSYKKISGVRSDYNCRKNCVVLASGAALEMYSGAYPFDAGNVIRISVDINGAQGPNVFGRDAFTLFLYPNGIIDELVSDKSLLPPFTKDIRETAYATCMSTNSGGYHGCFGKILNDNWEMNY